MTGGKSIRGRTILLTGANGFVGTRLAARLLDEGAKVRAMVRRAGSLDPRVSGRAEELVGDFADPAAAQAAAAGADIVVHNAATGGSDEAVARQVNAEGTRTLLAAARAAGVPRWVQISTVSVYELAANPDLVNEDAPLKTDGDPYGWTKAEGDRAVLAAIEDGLAATILRPTAILGAHATSTWAVRIPERIRDGKWPLLDDGANSWSWVHVDNLADALLHVLADDRSVGHAYNVVDGHAAWRDYVADVRRWFPGCPEPPRRARAELSPGQYWTGKWDTSRLRGLGWAPRRSYAEGMAEGEAWWRTDYSTH